MDEGLFELIILSSGGLLGAGRGVSHGYGGGWVRLHTPSWDTSLRGWGGVLGEVFIMGSLRFLQLLMQGPYVQGDFSELGTVCFLSLKTPS